MCKEYKEDYKLIYYKSEISKEDKMKKLGLLLILVGILFLSVPKISEYLLLKKGQDINISQLRLTL